MGLRIFLNNLQKVFRFLAALMICGTQLGNYAENKKLNNPGYMKYTNFSKKIV